MKRVLSKAILLAFIATPILADSRGFPPGATLTPGDLAHVFAHNCIGSTARSIEQKSEMFETVFNYTAEDIEDGKRYTAPEGDIVAEAAGGALDMTCSMRIPSDRGGDGAELYESLELHLPEGAQAVTPEAIEGGLRWQWQGTAQKITLDFIEDADGFLLTYHLGL